MASSVYKKKAVFNRATAMAAMTVIPLPYGCVYRNACEMRSDETFCCASLSVGALSQKNMFFVTFDFALAMAAMAAMAALLLSK